MQMLALAVLYDLFLGAAGEKAVSDCQLANGGLARIGGVG